MVGQRQHCYSYIGKALDEVFMTSLCPQCKKMDDKRENGELTRLELFLEWYIKHEPNCLVNYDVRWPTSATHKYILKYTNIF